ncbi:hypothetical protein PCANB_000595 [Pneumocystis canis]|nr:hypothetical protein PCK1_000539 [Pneumocystis canis]KAG5437880.1 hypothetical protein PCANB_000595 [Pneumocystis canis]
MNIRIKDNESRNELYESRDEIDKSIIGEIAGFPGFYTVQPQLNTKYNPYTEYTSHKESVYKIETPNEPLYQQINSTRESSSFPINIKQYHRILKRRQARAQLQATLYHFPNKPYLHESRHKHAMRRLRGPGGRFLSTNCSESDSKKILKKVQENEIDIYDSSNKNIHQK